MCVNLFINYVIIPVQKHWINGMYFFYQPPC